MPGIDRLSKSVGEGEMNQVGEESWGRGTGMSIGEIGGGKMGMVVDILSLGNF